MRTLGLLGGMSWESTLVYYRALNQGVARRVGGLHSAPLLLHSFDFAALAALQEQGRWDLPADRLLSAARGLREDFLRAHVAQRHGVELLVPEAGDRETVHRVIYGELCRGIVRQESRDEYVAVIGRLVEHGAEGVVLGCTKIGLLLDANALAVPGFDSSLLHVQQALDWMLEQAVPATAPTGCACSGSVPTGSAATRSPASPGGCRCEHPA